MAVILPRPGVRAVSTALLALGATGLQEDVPDGVEVTYRQPWDRGAAPRAPRNVLLRAWFDVRPTDDDIEFAIGAWANDVTWSVQAEQDWAEDWKKHFQPIHISDRLVIAAPWHGVAGALLIEPGNAFGTGEHPTTRACLRAIDALARPGATLLDVGCGSGILALAGAHLGMTATGVDIDPDAVVSARAAADANGLHAHFDTTPLQAVAGPYDLVVANLFAEVLAELAPELLRVSRGPIALAGILADRADLVRQAFASRTVLRDEEESGWVSLWYAA
jgi:ribosomal protein L11 methyltransferase